VKFGGGVNNLEVAEFASRTLYCKEIINVNVVADCCNAVACFIKFVQEPKREVNSSFAEGEKK